MNENARPDENARPLSDHDAEGDDLQPEFLQPEGGPSGVDTGEELEPFDEPGPTEPAATGEPPLIEDTVEAEPAESAAFQSTPAEPSAAEAAITDPTAVEPEPIEFTDAVTETDRIEAEALAETAAHLPPDLVEPEPALRTSGELPPEVLQRDLQQESPATAVTPVGAEAATAAIGPDAPHAMAPEALQDELTAEPATAPASAPASAESTAEPTTAAPDAPPAPAQTVIVTVAPPPKDKGNRGAGVLFSLLAAVAFAALFAGAIALVMVIFPPERAFGGSFLDFLDSAAYWVPIVVYAVAMVIMALLVNRARWWVWVIGGFLVAAAVFFGSIGGILLASDVIGMTPEQARTGVYQLAVSAPVIVATVLAREVTVWFGAIIAARGRRVTARNVAAKEEYEEQLERARSGNG